MVFCVPVVYIVCINAVLGVIFVQVFIFRLEIHILGGRFSVVNGCFYYESC